MKFVEVAPKELYPDKTLLKDMKKVAAKTGGTIEITDNIEEGIKDADVLYTDVWISMGEEKKEEERIKLLLPYQITMDTIKKTGNKDVIFLHCLPSFHDLNTEFAQYVYEKYDIKEMEVTDEVFRSHYSKVFDEAENRMHTIKAVMVATMS
jgi:ornithine carbamoyltransferase